MGGNYEFHKFFGNKPLDIVNKFESLYAHPRHRVYEEVSKDNYQFSPKRFRVQNKFDLKEYVEDSQYADDGPLDFERIICVINHEEFDPSAEKETLIFYEDGYIIRTKETSGEFMNRIFKHSGMSYDQMRELMRLINGQPVHCCPYVKGHLSFMPIYGPCKQNVSWVSLAHLLDYRKKDNDDQQTRLEFFNRHYFDFPLPVKVFDNRLASAAKMYAFQHQRCLESAQEFGMSLIQREGRFTRNVLHRRMGTLAIHPQFSEVDLAEQMMGVTYKEWKKEKRALRNSPYLEELDNIFLS